MRLAILSCICCLLGTSACNTGTERNQEPDEAVRIRIRPVERKEVKIPVRTTGILGTSEQIKLSFKTGGLLKELHYREGEPVRKGAVLAVLDLVEIEAQAAQAEIGFEKARRDLERATNLYLDSVATLEQYQNAKSAVELAESQKEIAEFNLQHSRIRAPSDGRILKHLVETSEMIAPGYPVILYASTEDDWVVRVSLSDKDIVKFSAGDSALVTMDAFPGRQFRAEITEMGSVSDPVTGTYEVELIILQSLPQFRTGYFCRAELFRTGVNSALVVPFESLLDASDDQAFVYTYRLGEVTRRRVRTGPVQEGMVVITEGLEEGDTVVTEGAKYVRAELEVLVVDPLKSLSE